MPEIQEQRSLVTVPGGLKLHEYTNLYFTARNPMLYKRRPSHASLTVLRVSLDALDLPNVVITDGNAASEYIAFFPSPSGLSFVDYDLVFARYWTDPDEHTYWHKKRCKCTEVLVPHRVPPTHILGAYASCQQSADTLHAIAPSLSVALNSDLFFLT